MACPYLTTPSPYRCAAVAGASGTPPRFVLGTLCRAAYQACPAYRFTRVTRKLLHPADFVSWVVLKIPAGYVTMSPQQG